jgi:hypothetical protein
MAQSGRKDDQTNPNDTSRDHLLELNWLEVQNVRNDYLNYKVSYTSFLQEKYPQR